MRATIIIWLIVLLTWQYAQAQSLPKVNTQLTTQKILIGDRIRYTIEVIPPTSGVLHWANIPDTFHTLEVVERSKIDTLSAGGASLYRQEFSITGFDSGLFKIPAFPFYHVQANGDTNIVYSDSFLVEVWTVPIDTTKPFYSIKEIIAVKTTWKDYIGIVLGVLAAVALLTALILFYLRRRKKKPEPAAPPVPAIPLYERTMNALEALEAKQLWQQEKVKEYYSELTDILRGYIEERFLTPAMELTTDELLETIHRHVIMRKHYDQIALILTTADLAKFAKAKPLPQEHILMLSHTRSFVTDTRENNSDNPQHAHST